MTKYQPGDILFVSGTSIEDRAIQLAQRRRDGRYAVYNHCALIVGPDAVIEAAGTAGVRRNTISAYAHEKTMLLPITATDEQRAAAVTFARSCVGAGYGWLDIPSVGLNLLTSDPLILRTDHSWMCSELCARALEQAGYTWPRDPANISPGDLAGLLQPVAAS